LVVLAKEGIDEDVQARYRKAEQVRPWLGVNAHEQAGACGKSGSVEKGEACGVEILAQGGEVCAESHQVIGD
jgi:hypothetical protein